MTRPITILALMQAVAILLLLVLTPVIVRLNAPTPLALPEPGRVTTTYSGLRVPAEPSAYAAWVQRIAAESATSGLARRSDLERQILELINAERAAAHLAPLAAEPLMESAAFGHAFDMASNGYLDSVAPNLWRAAQRIGSVHRRFVGEVLEGHSRREKEKLPSGAAAKLLARLLASPDGRLAVLAPNARQAGVGVVETAYEFFVSLTAATTAATLSTDLPLAQQSGSPLALTVLSEPARGTATACSFRDVGRSVDVPPLPLNGCTTPSEPGVYQLRLHWRDGERAFDGPLMKIGTW